MKRGILLVLVIVVVAVLAGCGPTKQIMYYDDPNNPTRVTRTEIEKKSFWASENLAMHYDLEAQAIASHERKFEKVSTQLIASHRATEYQTPVERILAEILLRQQLAELATYRSSAGPAPRTMVDQNWPAWGQLLLNGLVVGLGSGLDYDRSDSPGNEIKGDHNTFIYKSDVGSGQASQADIYLGDYSPYDVSTAGEGSPLSFDASRPYTYQPNNSRSNVETRTDSPSKSDNGIF